MISIRSTSLASSLGRRFSLFCLAFFGTVGLVLSQEKPPSIESNRPFSRLESSEIENRISELESVIEAARIQWDVPGLSVAIVHKDRVLLSKGYGVKQRGSSEAVDANTLFAIASNSKAFTAAALAILVDEKKLKWDDRVQDHLPWFQITDSFVSHEMRIIDLLCHRSGLGTFSGDLLWYGTPFPPKELVQRCRHLKPEGPFRSHYGYSNVMFLAAGLVVEKVSGETWGSFIQSRLLKPLGMNRSIVSVRDLISQGNFATPHKTHLDHSEPLAWVNWDSMAAAGGIISSATDMSQWMRMQIKQGEHLGARIISKENVYEMWQPHTPIRVPQPASLRMPQTNFRAYGLGWSLSDYYGHKVVGHGGGYDGMYSHQMLVPDEEFGVIVLSNSMTSLPNTLCYMALDMVVGAKKKDWSSENLIKFKESRLEFRKRIDEAIQVRAAGTKPSHPISEYAATYMCPMMGEATVTEAGGKLVLSFASNPDLIADLEHLHYDTFVIRWRKKFAWFDEGTILFVANARGEFTQILLDVPNEDLWFHELDFRRKP